MPAAALKDAAMIRSTFRRDSFPGNCSSMRSYSRAAHRARFFFSPRRRCECLLINEPNRIETTKPVSNMPLRLFGTREVFEQKESGLTSNHNIQISIAVNIDNRNLQSAAGSRAVVDDVPPPLDAFRSLLKLIPIDTQRLIRTWVMLMRFVAFSRDQLRLTIAI